MTLSLLADEHVRRLYVVELRANGYTVAWVDGDDDPGTPDSVHLERAEVDNLCIVTNDSDFTRLHGEYDHAGIVLDDDQNGPVTDFVAGVKRIERFVPANELRNSIVWLDEWVG